MNRQHTPWTPLDDGDLGNSWRDSNHSNLSSVGENHDNESYEMSLVANNFHSPNASAPLILQPKISTFRSSLSRRRRQFSGWKVGVITCAAITSIVCLLNIIVTIWAVSSHHLDGGFSQLYKGSCTQVAKLSLWVHLVINIMSTLLLSASNYTMQILSSPTRKEVDRAHARKKWLDIGVPSTRNLRALSWKRIIMWSMLGLSSVPLHLLYNTAIFSSLTANAYKRLVVTENFLDPNKNCSNNTVKIAGDWLQIIRKQALDGKLEKLSNEDCITEYGVVFVSHVRDVVLITSNNGAGAVQMYNTESWNPFHQIPFYWVCGAGYSRDPYTDKEDVCTLSLAKKGASSWKVDGHKINYCLVEKVQEQCQLRFSLAIMLVVIAANIIKAFVMFITFWKFQNPTLVTIGDAIASFLDTPDTTTAEMCLKTRDDFNGKSGWDNSLPRSWNPRSLLWFKAASIKRWLICNILCISFIATGGALLGSGMNKVGIDTIKQAWDLGFGKISPISIVDVAPTKLFPAVLLANLPQAILSFLYLTYNGLYSCMLGAHEWTHFAHSRIYLRVTNPSANQRSTYYLQLPYSYAIPLLILSGTLHWLMSQSLFLALVTVYDKEGMRDDDKSISTVGYSCTAIFCAIIVGSLAVISGLLNGFRKYTPGIPLVGSSSAALSAACHPLPNETSVSLMPLQWGVVNASEGKSVMHCALSSLEVTSPVVGSLYAGLKKDI